MGSVTPINPMKVTAFEAYSVVLHSLVEQTQEDKFLGKHQLPDNITESEGEVFYEGLLCAFEMMHQLLHALNDAPMTEFTEADLNLIIDKLSESADERG